MFNSIIGLFKKSKSQKSHILYDPDIKQTNDLIPTTKRLPIRFIHYEKEPKDLRLDPEIFDQDISAYVKMIDQLNEELKLENVLNSCTFILPLDGAGECGPRIVDDKLAIDIRIGADKVNEMYLEKNEDQLMGYIKHEFSHAKDLECYVSKYGVKAFQQLKENKPAYYAFELLSEYRAERHLADDVKRNNSHLEIDKQLSWIHNQVNYCDVTQDVLDRLTLEVKGLIYSIATHAGVRTDNWLDKLEVTLRHAELAHYMAFIHDICSILESSGDEIKNEAYYEQIWNQMISSYHSAYNIRK